MLCKTFKLNGMDFSPYAHKNGLNVEYTPISGLGDEYTLDGTLHDDVIANKGTYTITLNPCSPSVAKSILALYRTGNVFLTIYDVASDDDITILCKTSTAPVAIGIVKQADVKYWQLADLVFVEK